MAKVLLVDDEKNIRNGLRAIISRSGTVFTDIDECNNGNDALKLLSQNRYDLMITDLLMPQMDGIELVSKIDGMESKPFTVILSGFDEFKYAQQAITYGVKAYLLKPVDRAELLNILKKAEIEIKLKQEAENAARQGEYEAQYSSPSAEFIENQISLIFINENLSVDETEKIIRSCELDFNVQEYYVAVINFSEIYEAERKRENNSILNTYLKKHLAEMKAGFCSFLDSKGNVVVLLEKNIDIRQLLEPIEKMYGYRLSAGKGKLCSIASDMRLSYIQADYALRCRLLNPDERVINFSDIGGREDKFVVPVRLLKNLTGMLDTERKDDLNKLVHQIFDESIIGKYRLDYLEKLSHDIRQEIIQYLSEYIPQKVDFIKEQEDSYKSIYQFVDIQEYTRFISGYVMNINSVLLRMKCTYNVDDDIDKAVKYVKDNYGKDLTMAEVANSISLNYSYFSLLFKGKTGMNFIEYLKKVRIEKAKELLKNTDYKIYEISEMVGYNNTKHFTTTFREFTGISPKEYREKIYLN